MLLAAPVQLVGEGQYNLNALTQIEVTDSYLALDEDVRGCQTETTIQNCTTRQYIGALLERCGCLPFSIRLTGKVTCNLKILCFNCSKEMFYSMI